MNLLFVTNLYPNSREPTRATYNRQLAVALRDLGHDLHVIAPVSFLAPRPPRREILDGIPVDHPRFFYPPKLWIHHHDWFYRQSIRRTWHRVLREFKPDAALLGFIFPDAAAAQPLCLSANLPHAIRVNGSDFRIRIDQPRFQNKVLNALTAAHAIVCPGKRLKDDMTGAGVAPNKIHAFSNGIDHDLFHPIPSNVPEPDTDVLFVGNLVPVKAPERCIQACELVGQNHFTTESLLNGGRDVPASRWRASRTREPLEGDTYPRAKVRIIGDGPMRGELEKLAQTLPVDVVFEGRKPHHAIAEFIRHSRCVCLTSRSEGMPNIVLEALACGKPVVATDVGEVPHLVQNGQTGFVVAQEPEETLIQRLGDALRKTLAQEWNAEAISQSVQDFTWSKAAETVTRCVAAIPPGAGSPLP